MDSPQDLIGTYQRAVRARAYRGVLMRRHLAVTLAVMAAAAEGAMARMAHAQTRAPGVLLLVRPRVGDTLRLQMEQTIELATRPAGTAPNEASVMDGTRATRPRDSAEFGPRRNRATRITRLLMFAHSLVESSDLSITTLLATTDSMSMWAGSSPDGGQQQRLPLPLEGRQVRVRVTPDGAMRVSDPPPGAMELGATLAAMPGMLPQEMVRVGDRWERDMALPTLPVSGYRADGIVHANFRLDSITGGGRSGSGNYGSAGGRYAWISLEGTLRRDGAARELPAGTRVITAGTMRGLLVVDRERAWIVDARTTMDVQSEVSPGPRGGAQPVVLDLRIRQRVTVR